MFIDLRSDTVTRPGPDMRRAMAEAEVGDDVFGEDPTVNRLQEMAAELLGKEAALFVPSGTMANQICLRSSTIPGDEIICDVDAHVYRHEGAAGAVLSGLSYRPVIGDLGRISAEQVEAVVNPLDIHYPVSKVVALENTHNRGNGAFYSLESIAQVAEVAQRHNLVMHLDGARLFHACLAGGYTPRQLAEPFNTISFCLSKGLGAPVGSMVVTDKERMQRARRTRKQFGGGMRQAGILAAAAVFALEHHIDRLAEDHHNAARLAQALANMSLVKLDPAQVVTNIVIFDISATGRTPAQIQDELAQAGVGVIPFGATTLRAVTHLDVDAAAIDRAIEIMAGILDVGR